MHTTVLYMAEVEEQFLKVNYSSMIWVLGIKLGPVHTAVSHIHCPLSNLTSPHFPFMCMLLRSCMVPSKDYC